MYVCVPACQATKRFTTWPESHQASAKAPSPPPLPGPAVRPGEPAGAAGQVL